jgi:hypothetical protein
VHRTAELSAALVPALSRCATTCAHPAVPGDRSQGRSHHHHIRADHAALGGFWMTASLSLYTRDGPGREEAEGSECHAGFDDARARVAECVELAEGGHRL